MSLDMVGQFWFFVFGNIQNCRVEIFILKKGLQLIKKKTYFVKQKLDISENENNVSERLRYDKFGLSKHASIDKIKIWWISSEKNKLKISIINATESTIVVINALDRNFSTHDEISQSQLVVKFQS